MAGAFDLCCLLLGFYVLCVIASEVAYRYSKGKYKWIKRELKFLSALVKDFDEVSMSGNQITQEIGVTVQVMKEREEGWMKKATSVVTDATLGVQSFAKLMKRRSYHKWLLYVILNPVSVVDAVLAMNMFERRIKNIVGLGMNRKGGKKITDINGSLEQSRSKFRSLVNRFSVDEIESRPPRADELTWYPNNVMTGDPDLLCGAHHEQIKSTMMHLQLLCAFVEDLQRLKVVESEMEKRWMTEAIETMEKAKAVIDRNQRMWLSEFSDWMARRKLKKSIMHIGTCISDLLETKERYGIKFIRRQSSKSANRFPQQQYIPTTDLSSPVNNIGNWLNQLHETSTRSIQDELEQVHQLLERTNATEDFGAVKLRNTCWELLKKTASEADDQLTSNLPSKMIFTRIKNAVSLLQRCLRAYSIEVRVDSCSVVGLEEDVHELVSRLTTNSGSASSIISIVGMKGIGKTTLAKKVYDHDAIRRHFKVRRWVSMRQKYDDENALFSSVGNQVLETQNKGYDKQLLKNSMLDFFNDNRCLFIFDHVSSDEEMYALKAAFSPGRNGSRIVLITRNKAVGSNADQNSIPHQVRLRTRDESWELFSQMVEFSTEETTSAKEVVGSRLGGLPLDIMRVGFLLWGKKVTSVEIFRAVERITQGQNQNPWSENLAMIKKELQFHLILRKCFSYFKLFSRDSQIPIRRIVASLVAQGFVQLRGDRKRNPESVAFEYLSELIGRSMIQVVQRKRNGKFKTCRMPPAVQDLLFEDKAKHSFSYATTGFEGQLPFQFDDSGASFLPIHGLNTGSPNVLQKESILVFNNGEGNRPRMEGEFLRRGIVAGAFTQLLVLDLERVSRPQLPTIIGKLKQLAYLGLRRTELGTIPASIGNLVNLQTLDLKHTDVHTLPGSIWKLKNLRHLYLHQKRENKSMALPTAISMRNLQTLSGVFLHKANLVKDRLDKLINLRKLGLSFCLQPAEQKVLEKWIVKLTDLQSLKLRSVNVNGEPQLPKLEHISDLKNLHSLYLCGKLEYPFITRLPESLTHLTLWDSGLTEDPMPQLGKLPKLKSLSLKSGSYQGTVMVCSTDDFPLLFVLELRNLDTLRRLDVHEGAMPNLKEFEIKSCNNLEITTGF